MPPGPPGRAEPAQRRLPRPTAPARWPPDRARHRRWRRPVTAQPPPPTPGRRTRRGPHRQRHQGVDGVERGGQDPPVRQPARPPPRPGRPRPEPAPPAASTSGVGSIGGLGSRSIRSRPPSRNGPDGGGRPRPGRPFPPTDRPHPEGQGHRRQGLAGHAPGDVRIERPPAGRPARGAVAPGSRRRRRECRALVHAGQADRRAGWPVSVTTNTTTGPADAQPGGRRSR